MKISHLIKLTCGTLVLGGAAWVVSGEPALTASNTTRSQTVSAPDIHQPTLTAKPILPSLKSAATANIDSNILLCQGYGNPGCDCAGGCDGSCAAVPATAYDGFGFPSVTAGQPVKMLDAVNRGDCKRRRESAWRDGSQLPWEAFAYGEYIGPHRSPHVANYQLRINDQLEFVYMLNRTMSVEPYELYVGDVVQINSAIDASLNQTNVQLLADGTISLPLIGLVAAAGKSVQELQDHLNERYKKFVKKPSIVVQVLKSQTPLQDLRDSVDARAGQGGQSRQVTVSPDGTIQLPLIGSVPAIGLTLDEIGREVDARYAQKLRGMEVTPILTQRAPRFIYVVGEVRQAGRFEMTGPTSAIQAVALANGFTAGGNVRQIIVFRRDQNWQLTATKLDLAGALLGKTPNPSDEIWLRDSDIVLIPKKPIQRMSEAVNLYLSRTLYAIFPFQGVQFGFDNFTTL